MEHTVDKFYDVWSSCITCSWRRPCGVHFAMIDCLMLCIYSIVKLEPCSWYKFYNRPVWSYSVSCVWNKFASSECLYIKDCFILTTRLWMLSVWNSVLALLASCVDSWYDWLSDFNNAVYRDLSVGLGHNK